MYINAIIWQLLSEITFKLFISDAIPIIDQILESVHNQRNLLQIELHLTEHGMNIILIGYSMLANTQLQQNK